MSNSKLQRIALLLLALACLVVLPKGAPAGVFGGQPQSIGFVQANCGTVTNPGGSFNVSFSSTAPQLNDEVILFLVNNTAGLTYNVGSTFVPIDADAGTNNASLNEFSYNIIGTAPFDPGTYSITPSSGTGETGWCLVEYTAALLVSPVVIHGMKYTASGTSWTGSTLYPDLIPNTSLTFYGIPGTNGATWTNGAGVHQRAYSSNWSLQVTDTDPGNQISNTSSATSSSSLGAGEVDTLVMRPHVGNEITAYPIFEQGNCFFADSPSPLTLSLPNAPIQNDIILAYIENNGVAGGGALTYTPPAGFTSIDSDAAGNDSGLSAFTWWHLAGAAESGSYNFTPSSSTRHHVWCIAEYENVNTTTPVDQHALHFQSSPTTTLTSSSLTATNQQETPVIFMAPQGSTSVTWTSLPTNYAQRIFFGGIGSWAAQILEGPFTPVSGTVVAAQSATLSASQGEGDVATILLNSQFIPPATPGATPTPPGTPTPSPTPPTSPYVYHGCSIWTSNDWYTTPLNTGTHPSTYATDTVDPNSSTILSNYATLMGNPGFNINGSTNSIPQAVNLATNSTPMAAVTAGGGIINDPYGDDPNNTLPVTNPLYLEGQASGDCTGDCHGTWLNTDTCVDYESYSSFGSRSYNGSTYNATGYVHNLHNPLNNQYTTDQADIDEAGIPEMGLVDWGEDIGLPAIPHAMKMGMPGIGGAANNGMGGFTPPASHGLACSGTACATSKSIPFGARLRLRESSLSGGSCNAAYPATTEPQANEVCHQLATYGAIPSDNNGSAASGGVYNVILGFKSDGSNPWVQTDVQHLNGIPITDWDIMTISTCTNCNL